MRNLIAVAVLTVCQFTAFPLVAMVAANTARHSEEVRADQANVTLVYKPQTSRSFETL